MITANTEQNSINENTGWNWFRIVLIIAPALGYTLAYTYEIGYCNVFKIPKEFIFLDLTTVIIGITAAFGGSLLIIWFVIMLLIPKQAIKPMGPIRRRLYFLLLICMLSFFIAYKYLLVWELIYIIAYLVAMAVILLLFPLLDRNTRKIKGYRNKLIANDEQTKKSTDPLLKRIGSRGIIVFMLLVGAYTFTYLEGRAQAINQEEFYVPSTYPSSVVLRIYGDNIVCAPVNQARKEIERTYFILKTNDEPRPMLIATKTGRLYVSE